MRLSKTTVVVVLSLCLSAPVAYADLDSPTYAKARDEFVKGNCYEALPLLKKYRNEDIRFLDNNPRIFSAIKDAIEYCQDILFPGLPGTSYPTGPPQKPDLPVNLAHAFDTAARLRTVIAELEDGKPDYGRMEPMLRIAVRQQIASLVPRLKALGSLLSITLEGEQQGADVYEVKFTNGTTAWMIAIAPNGNISTLVFQ